MMLKRISKLILLCMLAMLPARGTARADGGGGSLEYKLKAAFIYNFAQFVEWPSDAFSGPSAPFVIGVLGDSSLAGMLEQAVKGKTAGEARDRRQVLFELRFDPAVTHPVRAGFGAGADGGSDQAGVCR